jgi:thioredoxin 1
MISKGIILKKRNHIYVLGLLMGMVLLLSCGGTLWASEIKEVPVKGMVTMVDLGAATCIPCKMMAPILEKMEKRYKGKAVIIFIDLRYQREAAQHFGVRAIPTQVFYDRTGRESYRHVGFMSEEDIVKQLSLLGVF